MQTLNRPEIFDRIGVEPPYFALREVEVLDGARVRAIAPVEQPLGAEVGPISGAEAGRHLAIAGSIAAAWANPRAGRFNYLAVDAEIRRAKAAPTASVDHLHVDARAQMLDKRMAHAMISATTPDGVPVCSLSCYYAVVGHQMMHKMFANNVRDTPPTASNPYVELIDPLCVDVAGGHIEMHLGPVDPAGCVGHFDGLPAMPVAYLMSNVTSAASRLLDRCTDGLAQPFAVIEGSVRADGLAFAGEDVVLRGEYLGRHHGLECLQIEATADCTKRVGAVQLKVDTSIAPG